MSTFYDFEAEDVRCEVHKMEEYRGKVVLVVNSTTECGFTPQYDELQEIYEKYQPDGFEILDFPCNQFANQAPGTNDEIAPKVPYTKADQRAGLYLILQKKYGM